MTSTGSSPLTRGKQRAARDRRQVHGLIPAHAGKTPGPAARSGSGRAHPRSRGENFQMWTASAHTWGSSPLTRGKRPHLVHVLARVRLIPAHAGKTLEELVNTWQARAHPRSRGENSGLAASSATWNGSSPLTRGKRVTRASRSRRWGLIPAHAGKTCSAAAVPGPRWAHPRSRGENIWTSGPPYKLTGSSPLTRGKRKVYVDSLDIARLIPAHAGKTLPDLRFYRVDRSDLGKP